MTREKGRILGQVLRDRRRHLDLTQSEVANRIGTSVPYIGHLEAGKRHPSDTIILHLAEALDLDSGELFFLANPQAKSLVEEQHPKQGSSWEEFRRDERLRRIHNVSADEMEMLSRVAMMGEVRSVRDFIYILNTVRQALAR